MSISQRLSSVGTEIVFPAPRVLLEAERKELKYDRLMHLHFGLKMGKIVQRIMRAVCMVRGRSQITWPVRGEGGTLTRLLTKTIFGLNS